MTNQIKYKDLNRESWNKRTEIHVNSKFYDNKGFIAGRNSLNDIELPLLGDLKGLSVLHLQCHFGQDTISLTRLGATATGVDLSDKAIEQARKLAVTTGSKARFIECDLYDLPRHLDDSFDIVFTSYGTIGWLPDLDKWAGIVSRYLKPRGRFIFVEFHPFVWMYDDEFNEIRYPYFNTGPILESEVGTYAQKDAPIRQEQVWWNHHMSEVVNSLLKQGLSIASLDEYDYSPYDNFNHTEEFEPGKYRIKKLGHMIPLVYSITAIKK